MAGAPVARRLSPANLEHIPAVVGCGDATEHERWRKVANALLREGDTGYVYADMLDFSVKLQRRHHGATAEGHDECRQPGQGI